LLTKNRREWLPHAVACYTAQTYANRELLIVADSSDDLGDIALPDCRVLFVPKNVGAKRNAGCAVAAGVIAHFDDDDHSEPGRLAGQIAKLLASGKSVTGYHTMKVTNGKDWWQYQSPTPQGAALGTSLCYTKAFWAKHRFEEIQCGQDEAFVCAAVRERQLITEPDQDLMYFTAHSGNTSPRQLPRKTPSVSWLPLKDFSWQTS
jgi:glycosyltransferase involved in cell wall biosynthesis